ncbi:MAG: GNAT family N-acetyltransferase [Candidatus Promineifilaceae bacterium]
MDIKEILALYDKEMRQEMAIHKGRREILPELIREIYDDPKRKSFIVYNTVSEENADAVIEREVAYFRGLGRRLEWKVFEHDPLPDLHLRLAAHGFEVEAEGDYVMALDLIDPPEILTAPITADIRRILDPTDIEDVMAVEEAVWEEDFSWLKSELGMVLQERPDELSIYVAYVDGKPASSGWVYFHPGTHFASMWGGSTLPAYRKQGLYTALVAVRVQEAISRGFRFLTIDAGPMSRPIVARHGFRLLTTAYECNLNVEEDSATN